MALLDQLQSEQAADHSALLSKYAEILARQDEPKPGDSAEVRRIIGVLGITESGLAADAEAAKNRVEYRQSIGDAEGELAKISVADTGKAVKRLEAAREELREAELAANSIIGGRSMQQYNIMYFKRELTRLEQSHPRVFGRRQ